MSEDYTKRDFIYGGRRMLVGNRIGHAVFPIGDDGEVMPERLYHLKTWRGIVGGVYRGAEFSENRSLGIINSSFVKRWDDPETVIAWEAAEAGAEAEQSSLRLQRDAKKQSELAKALLPIRRAIHKANVRGAWQDAAAIRTAVSLLLAKPLTKEEIAE